MASYLSIPIFDELVRFVEDDPTHEDSVKAMASGILNYYFPTANGYTVASKQSRNNNYADFIVLRVGYRLSGDRTVIDHTLAQAKPTSDPISLDQLENALEHANTEFGRCWAAHAPVPLGPPSQQQQSSFDARNDSVAVDWMLRFMAQHDTPSAR